MAAADHDRFCSCEDCVPIRREDDQLLDWRLSCLLELAFEVKTAERFARDRRIDIYAARELVLDRGCPPALAQRILEPV